MTIRALRAVDDPMGSYLRVTRSDTQFLGQMLVDGRTVGTGLIADPALANDQRDLWIEAHSRHVETVLDSRALDLSTPGGLERSGARTLPWANDAPHQPEDLVGLGARRMVEGVADAVANVNHAAVLAPTHLLDGVDGDWGRVDAALVDALRRALDDRDLTKTSIYYPLIARGELFYDAQWRASILNRLSQLPIDGVWLRIHPFGTRSSGPLVLKRYLRACRDLHALDLPLVGEHTGTIGVALTAFGAIGGVESGITVRDHTDLTDWLRVPKKGNGGGPAARIYLQELGCFIDRKKADALFERQGMKSTHACLEPTCCRNGWKDTRKSYREHFVTRRAMEVAALSTIPANLRPGIYMEKFLRPASDAIDRVVAVEDSLEPVRKQLRSWRGTLGADLAEHNDFTFSPPAAGRRRRSA